MHCLHVCLGQPTTVSSSLDRVSQRLRSQVLQWAHTSWFACHPGANQMLKLRKPHIWWPGMAADTSQYVAACSVCAQGKTNHQASASLLIPVPVPGCPWTCITLAFATGLPPSQGNTVILSVVDSFSKKSTFYCFTQASLSQRNC